MESSEARDLAGQGDRRRRSLAQLVVPWIIVMSLLAVSIGGSRSTTAGTCPPVQNTLKYTIVYGDVTVGGQPAAEGTVVEGRNGDGIVAGCSVVTTAGSYGAMYVYGEDTSVDPPIPGMGNNEVIAFYVDGVAATATPQQTWSNDKAPHEADLSAEGAGPPCYDFDHSGTVGSEDIQAIASAWCNTDATSLADYDFNDNDVVDCGDIQTVAAHWGEPSSC